MNSKLQKLLAERDRLLEENPHLQEFQKEIDNALKGVEDPRERLNLLGKMVNQKMVQELVPALNKLSLELQKIAFQDGQKFIDLSDWNDESFPEDMAS